jgi:hypothetical protein
MVGAPEPVNTFRGALTGRLWVESRLWPPAARMTFKWRERPSLSTAGWSGRLSDVVLRLLFDGGQRIDTRSTTGS